MTDVTYGQFFWALSLPFILEKKEVLTFMLFSKANVLVMSKLDCVHTMLPAPGKQGLSVSSPYFIP